MIKITKNKLQKISVIILILLVAFYFFFDTDRSNSIKFDRDKTYVHFLDVGQGDCTIIQSSAGNILIDAGTFESAETVIEYANKIGIKKFDVAVFTHPHSDHIGGAIEIIDNIGVEKVVMPYVKSFSNTLYDDLIELIDENNCEKIMISGGKKISVTENYYIDIYAPIDFYGYDNSGINDVSIIAEVVVGDVSFMFTGDASQDREKEVLSKYGEKLDADILKAGHHGSSDASNKSFVDMVSPDAVIFSAGKDNGYGHPHRETVSLFKDMKVDQYLTYEHGNIVVSTDGHTFDIITEK